MTLSAPPPPHEGNQGRANVGGVNQSDGMLFPRPPLAGDESGEANSVGDYSMIEVRRRRRRRRRRRARERPALATRSVVVGAPTHTHRAARLPPHHRRHRPPSPPSAARRQVPMSAFLAFPAVVEWLEAQNISDPVNANATVEGQGALLYYLPARLTIEFDARAIAGSLGKAAAGGYVAFNLYNGYAASWTIVMDMTGALQQISPSISSNSIGMSHFCALKNKDEETLLLVSSVNESASGAAFLWSWRTGDYKRIAGARAFRERRRRRRRRRQRQSSVPLARAMVTVAFASRVCGGAPSLPFPSPGPDARRVSGRRVVVFSHRHGEDLGHARRAVGVARPQGGALDAAGVAHPAGRPLRLQPERDARDGRHGRDPAHAAHPRNVRASDATD